MNAKRLCGLFLACLLALPASTSAVTKVGVAFKIDSPRLFSDATLGQSKAVIESAVSQQLVDRLRFYFPFLEWESDAAADNRLEITLTEQEAGLCGRQSDLVVRAVRGGNAAEMTDVPPSKLYDACETAKPNQRDEQADALLAEDEQALLLRLGLAIENADPQPGEPEGMLNNGTIREAIQTQFLGTIPLASEVRLEDQADGTGKFLYLPVMFDTLKSVEAPCDGEGKGCSRLLLRVERAGAPPAKLTLRVAGNCGNLVLCEILDGDVPGDDDLENDLEAADETYWIDGLDALFSQAQVTFTMVGFAKDPLACTTLADSGAIAEF